MKNFIKNIHSYIHTFTYSKLAIVLIISQLAFCGCSSLVTEIDPSILPQTDSELVVACFISPQDTVLAAKVTETKTVINSTGSIRDDITTATVKLSDGIKTVQLIYNSADGYYRALPSSLPIVAGKSYSIAVSTPDGRKVDATATVPTNVPINEMKLDSAKVTDTRRGVTTTNTEYTVKVIWQDIAGMTNYYRAVGFFEQIAKDNLGNSTTTTTTVDFRTTDDKGSDGQLISLTGTFQPRNNTPNGGGNQPASTIKLNKIKIGLFQTDVAYYNYHKALRQQRGNSNPFAEPILLYSNINGGFGCFGAYNATWQDLKVK